MRKSLSFAIIAAAVISLSFAAPVKAQLVSGPHGSEDMKIGVAGYSYRNFSIDETLAMLQSMDVKYLSIKDWWLPLDSTKEQMDAFNTKEELDESDFAYTTIFVFSANADREEVLNTFNKATLRLPHEIWFLQNDDLSEDLEYKIFIP